MQFFILTTFKFNNPPNYKNFIFSKFNSFVMQIKYNNNRNYYCYYFVKIILVFIVLFFQLVLGIIFVNMLLAIFIMHNIQIFCKNNKIKLFEKHCTNADDVNCNIFFFKKEKDNKISEHFK